MKTLQDLTGFLVGTACTLEHRTLAWWDCESVTENEMSFIKQLPHSFPKEQSSVIKTRNKMRTSTSF